MTLYKDATYAERVRDALCADASRTMVRHLRRVRLSKRRWLKAGGQ